MNIKYYDFKEKIRVKNSNKIKSLGRICLVQMEVGEKKNNIEKIKEALFIANQNKCKMIIFPEDSFWGILRSENVKEKATKAKEVINLFSNLANKYNIEILASTVPYLYKEKVFNTSFYFNNNGVCVNKYKKINLWLEERDDYDFGKIEDIRNVKSCLGKLGQTICWDLVKPNIYSMYKKLGVEIIVNQSFWYRERTRSLKKVRGDNYYKWKITTDYRLVDNLIQARANENNAMMIYCNCAGRTIYDENDGKQMVRPIGISQITLPIFGPIAKGARNKEEIMICEIPDYREILNDYEKMYGV